MILKVNPQFLPKADCPAPSGDGERGRLGTGIRNGTRKTNGKNRQKIKPLKNPII